MGKVEELTKELAAAILDSEEYHMFRLCEAKLKRRPDLYRTVNEMRAQNFELQNTDGIVDMYEATEALRLKYQDIREVPLVKEYLLAEVSLGKMIREIYFELVKGIDFDMSFLR